MTDFTCNALSDGFSDALSAAERERVMRGELSGHGRRLLSACSPSLAGVFALMLAVSRLPGIEKVFAWPLGFFCQGSRHSHDLLARHLVPRGLCSSCLDDDLRDHTARAAARLARAHRSQTGGDVVSLSVRAAFINDTAASHNNYVPLIVHRAYISNLAVRPPLRS